MGIEFAGFTWPKQEWALPVGTPAKRVGKRRYTSGYYENAPRMAGKGTIGFYWMEGGEESGRQWSLRLAKMHDIGWYTDSFCDDALYGFALRLPHGRGFLAGWTMGEQMCACLNRRIYETEEEALDAGHWMAESAAERMREDEQKFQAEQQIEEKREEVKQAKGLIRECIAEIKFMRKHTQGLSTAYEVLRERICSELAEIRKARKRIALLEREPWQAVA